MFYTLPQILLDIMRTCASYWIAFTLRLDNKAPSNYVDAFRRPMPWVTIICLAILALSRFYDTVWQSVGLDKLIQICFGADFASMLLLVLGYTVSNPKRLPLIMYMMGDILMLLFMGFSRLNFRLMRRARKENEPSRHKDKEKFRRVMIIGTGETDSIIIKEMRNAFETSGISVVTISDSHTKHGNCIHDVKVVGGHESITRAAVHYNVGQILLTIPTSKKGDLQETLQICSKTGYQLKTVPEYSGVLENNVDTQSIRDVEITDLLSYDEITFDADEICGYLKDKVVLITDGDGSIDSKLCRQTVLFNPKKIIISDIYENNAYNPQDELLMHFKRLGLEVLVGSVHDTNRISHVFEVYHPDAMFHAAVRKYVSLMELNPGEVVKDNVSGTLNMAEAAGKYDVKHMVLIPTGRAVNLTNVMSATKRIYELIIQRFSRHNKTDFVAIRFGSVLGNSGSVVLPFKEQIISGGPVTVTYPGIIRYLTTTPEAACLVLRAGGMAGGGKIFMLGMGQPVKIADLARDLIRLSGYEPDTGIKIVYTGLRPDEKLYEELLLDSGGGYARTSHELIYTGTSTPFNEETSLSELDTLCHCAGINNVRMMKIIHHLVPTYSGHTEKSDTLIQAEEEEEIEE